MFRLFASSFGSEDKPMTTLEFLSFWSSLSYEEQTELWIQWLTSK